MTRQDMDLLREFVAQDSEPAFAAIVSRHINLVYSAALRQVGSAHQAEEITQAVFIILARKAGSLGPKTILPAWLYRTACVAARDALRTERRRLHREQEAYMQSTLRENQPGPAWQDLSPLLDEAMTDLRQSDREAIVLRFFGNKTLPEVAVALGVSEVATKKRVSRALEKLRRYLGQRGVVASGAGIADTIAVHSVQAAPAALKNSVTTIAMGKGGAVSASTLALVQDTLKPWRWSEVKAGLGVGAGVVLVAGMVALIVSVAVHRSAPSPATLEPATDETASANQTTPPVTEQTASTSRPPVSPRNSRSPRIAAATTPHESARRSIYPIAPRVSDVIDAARAQAGQADGPVTIAPDVYALMQYGNLFQKLDFAPDQMTAFTKILEDRQDRAAAVMREHPLDTNALAGLTEAEAAAVQEQHQQALQALLQPVDQEADSQIKQLLGTDERYNSYQTYNDQQKERAVIMGGYREGLEAIGVPPLTLDQVEQLVALIYQNRIEASNDPTLEAMRFPQMLEQAGTFLTPEQVQVLTKFKLSLLSPARPIRGAIPTPLRQ